MSNAIKYKRIFSSSASGGGSGSGTSLIGFVASGTDTYSATPNPALTSYVTETAILIKFTNANTGAATINLNGLGAKAIVKGVSTALVAGDIVAGMELLLIYDGTNYQIDNRAYDSTINMTDITTNNSSTTKHGFLKKLDNTATNYMDGTGTWSTPQGNYWPTVPGTPVRVGNTSFTITDTANAGLYDQLISRTTVLKWTDTGVIKLGMVVSATYAANSVTVTIIGDTLAASATMSTFKYALQKADVATIQFGGTVGVLNDMSYRLFAPCTVQVFGAFAYHGLAGTTNATTYNISKNVIDGTATILAAALSIASAAVVSTDQTATSGTTLVQNDYLTLNCVSVSTTPPVDVYVDIYVFSSKNVYLT